MLVEATTLIKLIAIVAILMAMLMAVEMARGRIEGAGYWCVGMLMLGLGAGMVSQRYNLDVLFSLVASMSLVSAGLGMLLLAINRVLQKPLKLAWLVVPVILMAINQWLYLDDYMRRVMGASLILGGLFFTLGVIVLIAEGNPLNQERVILLMVSLIPGVLYLLRFLIIALTQGAEYYVLWNSPLQLMSFYAVLLFLPLASYSYYFILRRYHMSITA
ncbi:hypothetical protein [Amphritea balenae]|uniref:Uncharacterized protein n=1 Tax=Amphritea balenae TaxID=452629 RepID=A0A3P1ST75_9GAMM|nr:hypothetical protein [Amphritea balenae]RRD00392.1 hypothetical protein EHS89_04675 [Amphritea balenae]GGK85830.1 hypothetical protein GCM10007941_40390 [Amphritea balenae]